MEQLYNLEDLQNVWDAAKEGSNKVIPSSGKIEYEEKYHKFNDFFKDYEPIPPKEGLLSAEEEVRKFFDLRQDANISEMDFSLTGKDLINFASQFKPQPIEKPKGDVSNDAVEAIRKYFDLRQDADIEEMDLSITGKELIKILQAYKNTPVAVESNVPHDNKIMDIRVKIIRILNKEKVDSKIAKDIDDVLYEFYLESNAPVEEVSEVDVKPFDFELLDKEIKERFPVKVDVPNGDADELWNELLNMLLFRPEELINTKAKLKKQFTITRKLKTIII